MSLENVEIVRQAYEAWNDRDLDAAGRCRCHVWTLRNGRAVKLEMYQGTQLALVAAGLSNQSG